MLRSTTFLVLPFLFVSTRGAAEAVAPDAPVAETAIDGGAAKDADKAIVVVGKRRRDDVLGDVSVLGGEALARDVRGNFHFDAAAEAIEALLAGSTPPTALIADNDEMAFAALHVADKRGLKVPDDLSVVSFEDTPGVRFSVPPLTAIRQPTARMIATACEQLIKTAAGTDGTGSFELPYELIERSSTARPRA